MTTSRPTDLEGKEGGEGDNDDETDQQERIPHNTKQKEEHPQQICCDGSPPTTATTTAMIAENPPTMEENEERESGSGENQQEEPVATPPVVTTTAHLEALVLRMQQQSSSTETATPHLRPVPHDPDEFRALWSQTPAAATTTNTNNNNNNNNNVSEYTDRVYILYTRQQLSGNNWKRRLSDCVWLFWGGRTYYRIDRYHTQSDDTNGQANNSQRTSSQERWYPRACRYYHCPTEYISFCLRVDVLLRRTNAEWHRLHVMHHLVLLVALVLLGFAVSFWVAMPSHFQWDVASVFCLLLAVLLMGGRSVCFAPAHRRVVRDMSLTVQRCCRTATRRSRHISYDLQWRPKATSGVCGWMGIIHYDPYEWFVQIQPKDEQLWNSGGGVIGSGETAVPPPPPRPQAVTASQPQPQPQPPPQDERPADEEEPRPIEHEEEPRPIELHTARPNTTRWGDYEYGPNEV